MEVQLAIQTSESSNNARRIYNEGGHSKPYAIVTLMVPLTTDIRKGEHILGKNAEGETVFGKSYDDYSYGSSTIKVQYDTMNMTTMCQVGALVETNQAGCLVEEGVIQIDGIDHAYAYNPESDNRNGRTIAGFSETAQQKMMECAGCPYKDFIMFYEYYGELRNILLYPIQLMFYLHILVLQLYNNNVVLTIQISLLHFLKRLRLVC